MYKERHLVNEIEKYYDKKYDFILVDLPSVFNALVRSALYCSDYFLVPCIPDSFSAYCVGLIGEVLPMFINDWQQGKSRYINLNKYDKLILTKGQPKFAGWVFNGFETRKNKKTGVDKAQFERIKYVVEKSWLKV
ncbi:AAA family ATPase [Clostridium sp. JNZ X4-2]|jgi:cellulose biosynthesis protein BcsQ|uniref:AAA family ATPase n=1 Tax=Clostridium aromativorans TaxID=2836848 RepID=A0ABS8N126_9CLOT|nr:AAA family ATPase [Clostridium aromativorans]MCC9293498.1 AAA family ATPase [Clostridium aromativorans]